MGIIGNLRKAYYGRTKDRRKAPRARISVKVTNLDNGMFTYYHAANISVGGMFLMAQEPLPAGTRLRLDFEMPDKRIVTEAVVVRAQGDGRLPPGMGVRFEGLEECDLEAVAAFVAQEM